MIPEEIKIPEKEIVLLLETKKFFLFVAKGEYWIGNKETGSCYTFSEEALDVLLEIAWTYPNSRRKKANG